MFLQSLQLSTTSIGSWYARSIQYAYERGYKSNRYDAKVELINITQEFCHLLEPIERCINHYNEAEEGNTEEEKKKNAKKNLQRLEKIFTIYLTKLKKVDYSARLKNHVNEISMVERAFTQLENRATRFQKSLKTYNGHDEKSVKKCFQRSQSNIRA